ncbi:alpha/beta hydrolase [Terrimonas sp. NA20]|uniref:Alpha/beta hydrolase n=1 Tax=Terrimonas ginsenosidimutans TaxID=2908004 RepID=A0ABS9KKP0_9BACT|nr:alpha/beta hydrolase [Terrimonas ginsenosidimutans]MCG2612895.1 alpha/beta hydrolase [Terrimonas ginsenosidimutans]
MQNRWSDQKAQRIFQAKKIPLGIHDTLIGNRHLHYAITGSDSLPALVFIHGSPGSWMNYSRYMWDSLMLKKFRMISIDRPGFGHSDFGKAVHLQEQTALILPVLKSLKNGQPMYLCGHSMGGPVVVDLASKEPGLFKKVIIVAGALDINQEAKETWRHIMNVRPLYWLLPGAFAPSNTELLYLKKDLVQLQLSFDKVKSDILFIHGDEDTWVSIKNIGYGQQKMINAGNIQADTIFGADHMIPWKNQEKFREILLSLH